MKVYQKNFGKRKSPWKKISPENAWLNFLLQHSIAVSLFNFSISLAGALKFLVIGSYIFFKRVLFKKFATSWSWVRERGAHLQFIRSSRKLECSLSIIVWKGLDFFALLRMRHLRTKLTWAIFYGFAFGISCIQLRADKQQSNKYHSYSEN